MYGPPPDPREILVAASPADAPAAWAACAVVGLALTLAAARARPGGWTRAALAVTGQVTLLTAPLLAFIDRYVYGSFPTIDKEGSLLFYRDGVHVRMLADPLASLSDSAAALIGVHVGHLWVSQILDLFLSPHGAFNAQGGLYLVLGWLCAWRLLYDTCGRSDVAGLMAFPFGMGLHVFRDLNWYTIEKAATFFIPLYMWAMLRAARRGGRWLALPPAVFLLMCWINLYLGLVCGILAALAVAALAADAAWKRALTPALTNTTIAAILSALAAVPLAAWQLALMEGPQLATPEQFLWQRAALDGFSLVPLRWNRMEILAALHPLALAIGAAGFATLWRRPATKLAAFIAAAMLALSIGPALLPGEPPLINPVYMLAREVVPGFWRVAKPEVFFHVSWMLILVVGADRLARWKPSPRAVAALYLLSVVAWVGLVRMHPVYPGFAQPIESTLAPQWADDVFSPEEATAPRGEATPTTTPPRQTLPDEAGRPTSP